MTWIARFAVVLGLLLAPMSAEAENELLGTVAGTFNDESREFYSVVAYGEASSTFAQFGNTTYYVVEAYADGQSPFSSAVVSIGFAISGGPSEPAPSASDLEITYRPEARPFPFYADEEATFDLTISEIRVEEESAFIKADFTADLVLVEGPTKKNADERMIVTGSIDVEARKQ